MDHTRRLNDTYLLLEQLGEGGGGIVYKAYHERLRTEVVVKQVKERVKGKIVGRGEADVLKKLKHPYLPRVYDFLEVDGEIYTVMDYIPGDNLGNVLKKTPGFAQKEVLAWAKQLAEALAYLHGQEPPIIHSDIKPDNVMLLPDGKVCLIDFNISLAFDPSMRTATGISKGYSPPEQFSPDIYFESIHPVDLECTNTAVLTDQLEELPAETAVMPAWNDTVAVIAQSKEKLTDTVSMIDQTIGRGVDERSDIYSLGATLYHLLTGIKPDYNFQNVKPISQCGIRISEGFSHIIEKMMAILPEDRYQNGSELLNALEHIYEADHMYVDYRRKKRRRGIAIASLYILAAGCVGAGVVTLNWERNTAYNRAVEEADTLIELGDFDGAEIELGIALSKIPQRIDAYGKEVYRLYSMGDYDACIKYTKDILNNPQYMIGKGNDNDIEILGDIYYILGNSYFEKEDYGNARSCFEQALEYNQKNSFYYRDYAVVMAKTGNSEQAEVMLNQAVALGLGQDSVYFVMGEIAYSNGEYEAAIDYLRKTLDIAGSNQIKKRCVMLCAKAYESCGDDFLKEEINLLEQYETKLGTVSGMYITEQLGDAYARMAKTDVSTAENYYKKASDKFLYLMEHGYASFQVMENLAILYQQINELDEAEQILVKMEEKYPGNYIIYKRWAFLEADKQQKMPNEERNYQKMKQYYERAVELYENSNKQSDDAEMQMLSAMMEDLRSGGWF